LTVNADKQQNLKSEKQDKTGGSRIQ